MLKPPASLTLSFCAAVAAQPLVSPRDFAAVQGNVQAIAPLGQYPQNLFQQIHADLGTTPRALGQLAFRTAFANPQAAARVVEVELLMGDSSFAQRSRTFASNFVAPPQVVVARRQVALPDHTQAPTGGYPGPFDVVFGFDVPFVYTGSSDLAWQLAVFGDSTASGGRANFYPLDGFAYDASANAVGGEYGAGCTPIGRFTPMRAAQLTRSSWTPQPEVSMQLGTTQAPRSAQVLVLLALAQANLPIPGLCGPVLVNQTLLELAGAADNAGAFIAPPLLFAYAPRYAGLRFYTQAFAFEARPGELPYCVSSGLQFTVPPLPRQPAAVASVSATTTASAVSGGLFDFRGLVVELR